MIDTAMSHHHALRAKTFALQSTAALFCVFGLTALLVLHFYDAIGLTLDTRYQATAPESASVVDDQPPFLHTPAPEVRRGTPASSLPPIDPAAEPAVPMPTF